MALIKSVRGFEPQISESSFLAENACLIGDIEMGENCSFWYHSVVRGDVSAIKLGNLVNVQDGAIIHGTYKQSKTIVGNSVSIGHRAILHGCTVEDKVLIGMGAIVMDHAIIGSGSIIAAGAVVLKGTIVPPNSVFAGVPAKLVKSVGSNLMEGEIERIANSYQKYSSWFKE